MVTPGRFFEGGSRAELLHQLTPRISAGVNVTGSYRQYAAQFVPLTGDNRTDVTFSPGATLVFARVVGHADLRLRYNYIVNNSNDDAHDYRDHVVALSVATKF